MNTSPIRGPAWSSGRHAARTASIAPPRPAYAHMHDSRGCIGMIPILLMCAKSVQVCGVTCDYSWPMDMPPSIFSSPGKSACIPSTISALTSSWSAFCRHCSAMYGISLAWRRRHLAASRICEGERSFESGRRAGRPDRMMERVCQMSICAQMARWGSIEE